MSSPSSTRARRPSRSAPGPQGGFAGGCSPASCRRTRRTGTCRPRAWRLRRAVARDAARDGRSRVTTALVARLQRLERASDGAVSVCRTVARSAPPWARRPRRGAAHRGCRGDRSRARRAGDPARRRAALDRPRWSRPNLFGHGVPFRFPSSPDTGPGLDRRRQGPGPRLQRAALMLDLSATSTRPGSGTWPRFSGAPGRDATPTPTRSARARAT